MRSDGSRKPLILVAAYDVSSGASSEGHVAFNLLQQLSSSYRIVLVTRKNNKQKLDADPDFARACPGVTLVGFDLPVWARWWKRGGQFYQPYAYLWQMCWPSAVRAHPRLLNRLCLIHVLNFHNDSIPSRAWGMGVPVVWGPINHHEVVAPWRREFWPRLVRVRHLAAFTLRKFLWRFDPFLKQHAAKSEVIISAGSWVDRRLRFPRSATVLHRSQLGVSGELFKLQNARDPSERAERQLIYTGRLDWIKGVDLAIEALALMPNDYRLRIVGSGPAEPRLRSLAKELGVSHRVQFHGPVSREKLSSLYADADLYLFTSAEVAGLVWIEALASGLAVVAFDGETEVARAARKLPGIHLVKAEGSRAKQVEAFSQAVTRAVEGQRPSRSSLSATALREYGWDSLGTFVREAYKMALEMTR